MNQNKLPAKSTAVHKGLVKTRCHVQKSGNHFCVQSNQQLCLSSLMHSIHCRSNTFTNQALERISSQETLIGCGRMGNIKKLKGTAHLPCTGVLFTVHAIHTCKIFCTLLLSCDSLSHDV